ARRAAGQRRRAHEGRLQSSEQATLQSCIGNAPTAPDQLACFRESRGLARRQLQDIERLVEWQARLFHCRQLSKKIGPDIELHGNQHTARHVPTTCATSNFGRRPDVPCIPKVCSLRDRQQHESNRRQGMPVTVVPHGPRYLRTEAMATDEVVTPGNMTVDGITSEMDADENKREEIDEADEPRWTHDAPRPR